MVLMLVGASSFAMMITKTANVWHFTKISGEEAHAKWKIYQNDTLCWEPPKNSKYFEQLPIQANEMANTKDFSKKGCMKLTRPKKITKKIGLKTITTYEKKHYKIGTHSVEFEFGNITISVDLLYNQEHCYIGSDCIQKYKICSNATLTEEEINAFFEDLNENQNISTDFEVYEMQLQNISKVGYNSTPYSCNITIYNNETNTTTTNESTCYNTTEYTYTVEEYAPTPIESYEGCKDIYYNAKFSEAGHYDIIPSIYNVSFPEFAEVYVSYPYWIEQNENIWTKVNLSSTSNTQFYVYYGGSTDKSDGNSTFEFFDDFDYSSFDTSTYTIDRGDSSNFAFSSGIMTITASMTTDVSFKTISTFFSSETMTELRGRWITGSNSNSVVRLTQPNGFGDANERWTMRYGNSPYIGYNYEGSSWANSDKLPAFDEWSTFSIYYDGTNTGLYRNSSLIQTSAEGSFSGKVLSMGFENQVIFELDYIYVRKYNSSASITETYGTEETGSWTIDGETYTKRKQITISSDTDLSNYQVDLDYTEFNDTKLYLTDEGSSSSGNSPPEILSLNITPNPAYTNDTLSCNVQTRDNDTATIDINFKWYNSSVLFKEENLTNQDANGTYSSTIGPQYTLKHENWSCAVNITDGEDSISDSVNIIINNSIPIIVFGGVYPEDARTNSTIFCNASYYDGDNDNGIGTWMWYINDTNIYNQSINLTSDTISTSTYLNSVNHGEKVVCDLVISDEDSDNQTYSNFTYVVLPTCDDFLDDSGLYDRMYYGTQIYYIPKDSEPSSYTCYNDQDQFIELATSTSLGRTCYITEEKGYCHSTTATDSTYTSQIYSYYSPQAFNEEKTIEVSVVGDTWGNKLRIYNSSDSYCDAFDSDIIYFKSNNSITINSCHLGNPNKVFKIRYYIFTYPASYSSGIVNLCSQSGNEWLCNPEYTKRIDDSGEKPRVHLNGDGVVGSNSWDNRYNHSVFTYAYLTTGTKSCPSWFCNSGGKILFLSGASDNKTMMYQTDNSSVNVGEYYGYILQNNQIVQPVLSFYLKSNSILDYYPFPNFYSSTDYKIPFISNTGLIYMDELGLCYFVPPYTPTNTSTLYTLTAYQVTCPANVNEVVTYPVLPSKKVCKTNNGNFIINVSYSEPVIYERWLTSTDNTVAYTTLTSEDYEEVINTSNYAIIDLRVNNISRCYYSTNSTTLGLVPFGDFDLGVQKLVILPIILLATAISSVQPFAFIFVIALNDMFSVLDSLQLFLLAGFVSVFAVVSNWNGERTLKSTITLFLLVFAYIVSIHSFDGFAGAKITAIQNVIDNLTEMFSAINNPTDLLGIISITLPTFFVNLIILLISLPIRSTLFICFLFI